MRTCWKAGANRHSWPGSGVVARGDTRRLWPLAPVRRQMGLTVAARTIRAMAIQNVTARRMFLMGSPLFALSAAVVGRYRRHKTVLVG